MPGQDIKVDVRCSCKEKGKEYSLGLGSRRFLDSTSESAALPPAPPPRHACRLPLFMPAPIASHARAKRSQPQPDNCKLTAAPRLHASLFTPATCRSPMPFVNSPVAAAVLPPAPPSSCLPPAALPCHSSTHQLQPLSHPPPAAFPCHGKAEGACQPHALTHQLQPLLPLPLHACHLPLSHAMARRKESVRPIP